MNYVELHIGDYDKATAHLTACEDGIYGRLLRRYYDTEAPLPLDLKAVQRLVRARARDEREAVATVLEEFFEQTADGWRHSRCDAEIAKYQEKRSKAKRSAEARWSASAAQCERNANASSAPGDGDPGAGAKNSDSGKIPDATASSASYSVGAKSGDKPSKNNDTTHANASPNAMRSHSDGNAHQSPVTRQELPHEGLTTAPPLAAGSVDPPVERVGQFESHAEPRPGKPSPAAACAIALTRAGFQVTSMHPELIAYVADGGQPDALVEVANLPECSGKRAPYVIAIARRLLVDRAKPITPGAPHAGHQQGPRLSVADRVAANIQAGIERRTRGSDDAIEVEFSDVPS